MRGFPLDKMAVTIRQLQDWVLRFSLEHNQSLSQFRYPSHFEDDCKRYLYYSVPDTNPVTQQRIPNLNFDGFVSYNYNKGPEEDCKFATVEDVKNWQTAIKCLQRYCLNLLLAPRRQDFHQIKVSPVAT